MDTRVDEIADGIYRVSTFLPKVAPPYGLTVNQFVVLAEEPLLFHAGMRSSFPALVAALRRILPVGDLRWVAFGHVEADECGALNLVLAVAPHAMVAAGAGPWPGAIEDLSDRPVTHLVEEEALDLGGRRVTAIATPHAPHTPEAHVLYEETTGTLLCGDLFTQLGRGPAVTASDLVEAALDAERVFPTATPGPSVPAALRDLAVLGPRTVATMHGSAFEGDGAQALSELAAAWDERFGTQPAQLRGLQGLQSPHG
jgi:flavorubredoxin